MREDVNRIAVEAASDEPAREALIRSRRDFILSCAAKAAGRRITRADDEWSVALFAFSAAIDSYDASKGGFLSYAALLIRRRVIDFLRKSGRHDAVFCVNPSALDGYPDEDSPEAAVEMEVTRVISRAADTALAEEIESANEVMLAYGFSFFDLAACSPKSRKSRTDCSNAAHTLAEDEKMMRWMRARKMLPVLPLHEKTGVATRTISKFRRFIIAAAEIIERKFPALSRWVSGMRKEANR